MELVVGISRQSFINKVGSVPLGHDDAHDEVKACRSKKTYCYTSWKSSARGQFGDWPMSAG